MFEIGWIVMSRMVKEHGEVIINIYLSEIIRNFSPSIIVDIVYFAVHVLYGGCEKCPAISLIYLQERINQQNITASAEARMPLAFLL